MEAYEKFKVDEQIEKLNDKIKESEKSILQYKEEIEDLKWEQSKNK